MRARLRFGAGGAGKDCARRLQPFAWLLAVLLLSGVTASQAAPVDFESLDAATRGVLAPYAREWSDMSPELREALKDSAEQWLNMDSTERELQAERLRAWQALPESDRRLLRAFHERTRGSAKAQGRIQLMRERFRTLPPRERRALQERMARMTPPERRAFLLGLAAGHGSVGDQARRELLAQLDRSERDRLESLMLKLEPAQRQALRRQMADLSLERRVEWVRTLIAARDEAQLADLLHQGPP